MKLEFFCSLKSIYYGNERLSVVDFRQLLEFNANGTFRF